MSEVFILSDYMAYEYDLVKGVYTTLAAAQAAKLEIATWYEADGDA